MDQGQAVVLGAVIASAATISAVIVGALITAVIDWRRRIGERRYLAKEAERERVRRYELERVRDTRVATIAFIDAADELINGRWIDLRRAGALIAAQRDSVFSNARLIDRPEIVSEFATAVAAVFVKLPTGWRLWLWPMIRFGVTFSAEERQALQAARTHVLQSMERQHVRALRDEPLVELDPEVVRAELESPVIGRALARFSGAPRRDSQLPGAVQAIGDHAG